MIVMIDANQMTHRCHSAGMGYNSQDTGVIYSTLNSTKKIVKKFSPDYLVFCWDSHKSIRKEINTEYKANRNKLPAEVYTSLWQQEATLKNDVIPKLGWNQIEHDRLESDDIVANICLTPRFADEKMIIVSNDSDFYQLLDPMKSMYSPTMDEMYTEADFRKEYQVEPSLWAFVKAIGGCYTDNIKGLKGIGKDKAIKFLTLGKKYKRYEEIERQKDVWEKNLELVKLPIKVIDIPELLPIEINMDSFVSICQLYGFKSYLNKLGEWEDAFTKKDGGKVL